MTNQSHSGSGDNVAGNKKVNNYVAISSIWVAVGIVLIGLAIWLVPKLMPEPVFLEGYVVSNADVPIDKAKVVVHLPGAEEPIISYTDENGQFLFDKIDITEVPAFTIEAQFHERNQRLDFQNISNDDLPVTIPMPAGIPPFEVRYLDLAGYEVDFLISGRLNPEMAKSMGGQPMIVPNAVYQTLKSLGDNFSTPLGDVSNYPLSYEDDIANPKSINKKDWGQKSEFFTKKVLGTENSHLASVEKDIKFTNDQDELSFLKLFPGWELNGKELQGAEWMKGFEYEWDGHVLLNMDEMSKLSPRMLTQEEFNRVPEANGGDIYKFYKYLTKNYYPADFISLEFHHDGYCGNTGLRFNAPDLQVRVAILENTSRDPIAIDSFYVLENSEIKLRLEAEDLDSRVKPKAMKLLPQKTLKAGGKVLIPLAIQFVYRDGWRSGASAQHVYHYGPSWNVKEVKVGIEKYPFRESKSELYVLQEGTTIFASCPFAFTYDEASGEWLIENHFLYKKDKPSKQGFDTLALKRFTGELLIREIDPETSYIDLIEIHFSSASGETKILKPSLNKLRHKDGRHLITNQGDEVKLRFDGYDKKAKGHYALVSYGWYERYPYALDPEKYKKVGVE